MKKKQCPGRKVSLIITVIHLNGWPSWELPIDMGKATFSSESFTALGPASFLLKTFLGSRSHLFMWPCCELVSSQPWNKENKQSCSVSASCRCCRCQPHGLQSPTSKNPIQTTTMHCHKQLYWRLRHRRSWSHIQEKPLWLEGVFVCGFPWMEAGDVSLGYQLEQLFMFNASHALFYYTSNPLCLQRRKSCQRPLIQTEFNLSNSFYSGRAAKSIY